MEIKILITDDSKPFRQLLSTILKNKKVKITEAKEGGEAFEFVLQNSFDLILMDQNMPNMTGLEFLKLMKKYNKKDPVIMITAVNSEEAVKKSVEYGALDYIIKPFNAERVIKKINQVLKKFDKELEDK